MSKNLGKSRGARAIPASPITIPASLVDTGIAYVSAKGKKRARDKRSKKGKR